MRVMGIDPGLRLTGYACIEYSVAGDPSPHQAGLTLIEAGVLRLKQNRTVADRLVELDSDFRDILGRLQPSIVAVEKLFAHYKHPTTAAIMGHARGVVLLNIRLAEQGAVSLVELGATEVKKSLTGHGHAGKRQVQDAVMAQLGLDARPEPPDVADAIAIALCAGRRAARAASLA